MGPESCLDQAERGGRNARLWVGRWGDPGGWARRLGGGAHDVCVVSVRLSQVVVMRVVFRMWDVGPWALRRWLRVDCDGDDRNMTWRLRDVDSTGKAIQYLVRT